MQESKWEAYLDKNLRLHIANMQSFFVDSPCKMPSDALGHLGYVYAESDVKASRLFRDRLKWIIKDSELTKGTL